jgi:phosphatidylserine/phosphatidylglycerophosphate/cardiolipin synthase-like enzyme
MALSLAVIIMARMGKAIVGWSVLLAFFLSACATSANAVALSPTSNEGAIAVFFTDPNAAGARSIRGGPDEDLRSAIEDAHVSIDIAIYDLDLYGIRDALIAAKERGVQVRLVVESDNYFPWELERYTRVEIPVVGDSDPDAMHDKFVIIDRYEVWTGSVNYTVSDIYNNRNNLLQLQSIELAENYLAEFEEMFGQGMFGAHSPANTPNPQVEIDGALVETYFAPEDGVEAKLVDLVNRAQDNVYLLAYSFTSDDLAEALLAAQARGVEVRGVMDKSQAANAGGEYERLLARGIEISLDSEYGSMHHKVLIIDGEIVVTGSYNFSANAEKRNDENVLVIHSADLASKYLEEFWRLWEIANP